MAHKNVFHNWHQTNSIHEQNRSWVYTQLELGWSLTTQKQSAHGILLMALMDSKAYPDCREKSLTLFEGEEFCLPPTGGAPWRDSPGYFWLFPHTQKRKQPGQAQAEWETSKELWPLMLFSSYYTKQTWRLTSGISRLQKLEQFPFMLNQFMSGFYCLQLKLL